jgi:hypothetical protein
MTLVEPVETSVPLDTEHRIKEIKDMIKHLHSLGLASITLMVSRGSKSGYPTALASKGVSKSGFVLGDKIETLECV